MTRRGRFAVAALLLVAVFAVVTWRVWLREPDVSRAPGEAKLPRDPTRRVAPRPRSMEPLAWLAMPGAPARRVAGIVVRDGKPAADIPVELYDSRTEYLGAEVLRMRTGPDGRFDFGVRDPIPTLVTAVAPDGARAAAHVRDGEDTVLRLDCAGRITGRIHDLQGRPVRDARIDARAFIPGAFGVITYAIQAAADGRFDICANSSLLVAHAPGYATTSLRIRAKRDLDVTLFPSSSIEGVVLDAEGEPIADAIVMSDPLEAAPFGAFVSATTGLDGSFRIDGLVPGIHLLDVAGRDVVQRDPSRGVHVGLGERVRGVILRATRCTRQVAGHVVLDGGPVAHAIITIGRRSRTDADGAFAVACVPSETDVRIEVEGYDVIAPTMLPAATESIDDLVVTVIPGNEIRGRVISGGVGAKEARVTVQRDGLLSMAAGPASRTVTDDDGAFVLRGLGTGAKKLVAWDPITGARSATVTVDLADREIKRDVIIAIDAAGTIEATVVDRNGRPVAGVSVSARAEGGGLSMADVFASTVTTDAVGRASLRGLAPGTYVVDHGMQSTLLGTLSKSAVAVELARPGASVKVELRLEDASSQEVTGRVIDDLGAAIAYAIVEALGQSAVTDEEGAFIVQGLLDGKVRLRVTAPDGSWHEVDTTAGTRDLVITVMRAGGIAGRIVGGTGLVSVSAKPSNLASARVRRTISNDGTFRLDGIPVGAWKVVAEMYGGSATAEVDVTPGEVAQVTLQMGAPAKIIGVVRRFPDETALGGLSCSAGSARSESGADGSFELVDVTPAEGIGVTCANILANPPSMGENAVTVGPGETAAVEVWAVTASIETMALAGGDVGATLVDATTPDGRPANAFADVDADGAAAAAGIQNGDILVSVDGGDATGARASAAAMYLASRPAGTAVRLTLARGTGTVEARVTLAPR